MELSEKEVSVILNTLDFAIDCLLVDDDVISSRKDDVLSLLDNLENLRIKFLKEKINRSRF